MYLVWFLFKPNKPNILGQPSRVSLVGLTRSGQPGRVKIESKFKTLFSWKCFF
jgi:hypothetical protein